jgi:hypothetical protein
VIDLSGCETASNRSCTFPTRPSANAVPELTATKSFQQHPMSRPLAAISQLKIAG